MIAGSPGSWHGLRPRTRIILAAGLILYLGLGMGRRADLPDAPPPASSAPNCEAGPCGVRPDGGALSPALRTHASGRGPRP